MSRRGWGSAVVLGTLLALAAQGCGVMGQAVGKRYASQKTVLNAAAKASGYQPDPDRWHLVHLEVAPDYTTFQYRGVKEPGDRAWVVRFAQKTTEQRPDQVASIEGLLETIREGKEGFQILEKASRQYQGLQVEYARYRYSSVIRGDKGSPLPAGGAAALVILAQDPAPVIHQIDVDNFEGLRFELGWDDLRAFIDAIAR